jgi:O-antigen/teichoic acid export membrane protein
MRPALSRNVAASVANAGAVVATSLVTVPLILDAVGTVGYGVWTLGLAIILYAAILETGLGPSVQRFTAFARGSEDHDALARLAFTTVVLYALSGVVLGLILLAIAPLLVDLFDLPPHLRHDATTMFRILGGALALALLAAGAGNLAQGLERFGALAVSAAAGALAFLAGVLLLADAHGLPGLAVASCIGQAVTFLIRAAAVGGALAAPRFMQRGELRNLVGFSTRLQVTAFSELVNWQSDKLVVGIVATPATVAQLGIGAQFADGGRLLAGAALSPVHAAFAHVAGAGDDEGLKTRFRELHRLWVLGVFGSAVIGAASLPPLIDAWLGNGYGEAALLGAGLVLAAAAGLSTGTGVAYMRAIGRPSLEARMGPLIVTVNLALTIPLAIAAGARGVVIGTLGAYVIGAGWFFSQLRHHIPISPLRRPREGVRVAAVALAAAALSLGLGTAAAAAFPTGFALPFVGAALALGLLVYAIGALGVRPARPGRTTGRRGRG